MDSSLPSLAYLRPSPQQPSVLSQLCGKKQIFRNRYRVIQTLGRGGFGVTYLARDVSLPSSPECVIKQLCPKVNNAAILERATERFEREAKTLAQLGSHAHIPRLLDYFQVNGEFFLVQEYIRGVNLAQEVKARGVLSELAVKRFLKDLLLVLDYVHSNQVIHRDIKPLNIIRCQDDGRLVLIDFGAVKEQIAELDTTAHTSPSTQFVGTVGFAPPEQVALRPVYASDIYAVGITCLYLLTGKPPMEFDCDPSTGQILWQPYIEVSEHFAKVLNKMLKISVIERYQSVNQVLRALELEPYLDNLADCMNTKLRTDQSDNLTPEGKDDGYVSPTARKAQAIRDWRARLQAKDQGHTWKARILDMKTEYLN